MSKDTNHKKILELTVSDLRSIFWRHVSLPILVIGLVGLAVIFYLAKTSKTTKYKFTLPVLGEIEVETNNAQNVLKEIQTLQAIQLQDLKMQPRERAQAPDSPDLKSEVEKPKY